LKRNHDFQDNVAKLDLNRDPRDLTRVSALTP